MMFKPTLIVITVFCMFAWFALSNEIRHCKDPVQQADNIDTDSPIELCDKLWSCYTINRKTIKWRRTFLSALVSVALIFALVHQKIPNPQELLLYVIIIYTVWYLMWDDYSNRIESISLKNSERILHKLKRNVGSSGPRI
jgi:Mg2+/citrate symporter